MHALQPLKKDSAQAPANVIGKKESSLIRPPGKGRRNQEEETDETLARVRSDFARLCSMAHGQLGRLSSIQSKARLQLVDIWWPRTLSQTPIPRSVGT